MYTSKLSIFITHQFCSFSESHFFRSSFIDASYALVYSFRIIFVFKTHTSIFTFRDTSRLKCGFKNVHSNCTLQIAYTKFEISFYHLRTYTLYANCLHKKSRFYLVNENSQNYIIFKGSYTRVAAYCNTNFHVYQIFMCAFKSTMKSRVRCGVYIFLYENAHPTGV